MEDDEYKKLPVEDRCVHKLWKARVDGYENVTKLFRQIDEKSPEFQKYLGLVKKFVVDSNAMGQEKGLEATLAFVENYAHAGKTVGEVMSGIVNKCMAASKTRTRELALQVTLMYVEIEKQEIVMEELLKGMEHKNPKLVTACINASTTALREFGSKVIAVKPLVKKIPALFSDRDKGVRDEARLMVIEIYRWIGPALKSQLTNLQPVQVTELEAEFAKIDGQKAVPTRYLRSQQAKQAVAAVEAGDGEEGEAEDEDGEGESTAVDPYDLADPVEILSKVPSDFLEKIEAKKWTERKEVLEALENLVKAPKLQSGDYGDIVRALKKVVQKDSNVLCTALAAKCLYGLASGLKKRFQPYAGTCVPALLEKFKEKKANVVTAVRDAIDAIYLSTTFEAILEDVVEAFNNKNPSVKSETALFLARSFTKTQPSVLNKKILKTITTALIKIINESDPTVRDSSAEALGTLKKLVGDKMIMPFLVELEKDNLKMAKINEFCDKAVITVKVAAPKKEKPAPAAKAPAASKKASETKTAASKAAPKTRPKSIIVKSESNDSLDVDESEDNGAGDTPSASSQDTVTRVDITTQITEEMLNELSNSNWKERNEALIKIGNIISGVKAIKSNIGDLPQALAQRLEDSNAKIVQTTLNICESLANAMGPGCKNCVRILFPGFLKALGDGKAFMRAAALNCINTFGKQAGYKEFFEGEIIADALKSGTPSLRIELWNWLGEQLPNLKTVPKEELAAIIPILYTNLEDRNADVRKNAQEAVLGIMIHMGYESMLKQTEKLKPGSKTAVIAGLDKARPNLPMKPLPPIKSKPEKEEKAVRGTKPVATSKNAVKKPGSAKQPAPSSRKKEEETDTSPLLVVNNMKHQRTIDESKLKVLKWNFTTPREEFVELLKDLMVNAKVNKTLMTHMFHADFRYHIKAIESLMDDLQDNTGALISNLDLILKWFTLRFFDTNPSVLLKSLEYLQIAFDVLIENKYQLLENEAASFIPYLILKIGDPKDAVRSGVKDLCQKIGQFYAVSKLFSYVMDGLKSKNARQRAECLDLMGTIIEENGMGVCLPTPGACLKEVARQISDRDNSVRNAALNCLVQAYFIVGEKVYKMVGQICDKNMSLLEERIKRAQKKPPPAKPSYKNETISVAPSPSPSTEFNVKQEPEEQQDGDNDDVEDEEEVNNLPDVVLPPQVSVPKVEEVTGPYRLDPELLQKLDSITITIPKLKLQKFDLTFLDEDIKVPQFFKEKMKDIPRLPPKPFLPLSMPTSRSSQEFMTMQNIQGIASNDSRVALQAINQMIQTFTQNRENLNLNEDQFASAISNQFKILSEQDPRENPMTYRIYKGLLSLIDGFFKNEAHGKKISETVLKELINDLILLLVDKKLEALPDGEAVIRVINIQSIKIIERSNHTNIICALVILLRECMRDANAISPRHRELVMKCLWKIIKLIPTWPEDIDYDSVLLEIHLFLKEFPSSWWSKKESDTPLRTIKTILHAMAKIKGGSLTNHYGKIPNTHESEMEAYIQKVLKTLKLEEVKQLPLRTDSAKSLTRHTHTQLTEIFQKIGNKDETKEGLNQLYDFIQQHPEADIKPFLNKSSTFFQDYIQKNLKEIEIRRKGNQSVVSVKGDGSSDVNTGNSDIDFYREQLEKHKKMWEDKIKSFHS